MPWPEQSGRHCLASSSRIPQSVPFQPFLQMQLPSTQKPWSEHVGSGQSTVNNQFINVCKELKNFFMKVKQVQSCNFAFFGEKKILVGFLEWKEM